ncbi:MAG: histidine phosphatase family protein [Epsilonproteobacteria bacterium]|nr:histidine phosphatase family protein [Campylobacterota bacterium]
MKRLFIIRHAKSDWSKTDISDFDRGLKKRGKRDIVLMACWLQSNGYYPDIIISSPAKRAKKSAKKIAEVLGIDKDKIIYNKKIYEASPADLTDILSKIKDKYNDVFLVGHNPSLNELAEYLSDSVIFNIPTSGIICIEFDIKSWRDIKKKKGEILFFEYPKKLRETKSVKC